jgi:cytochrome P450
VAKFFSRQQMLKLEGEVRDFAQLTVDKMLRWAGREPFEVKEAFNCFTADVISQYAFGEPMGFVSQEAWEPNFATWVAPFLRTQFLMRHSTLARKAAKYFPLLSRFMGEDMNRLTRQTTQIIPGYVNSALTHPENGRVFREIAETKSLPAWEKSVYRLSGEGFDFLLAGTETTAVRDHRI